VIDCSRGLQLCCHGWWQLCLLDLPHGSPGEEKVNVQGELDELEREEFFRLKKVQDKKQRDLDKRKVAAAQAMNGWSSDVAPVNMLTSDDPDELF
jgi:hypothetical protein